MTAKQLIEQIEAAGGTLTLDGERIRCRAPREAAHLVEALRAERENVRRLLEQRQQPKGDAPSRLDLLQVGMRVWTPVGPDPGVSPVKIRQFCHVASFSFLPSQGISATYATFALFENDMPRTAAPRTHVCSNSEKE